MYRITRVHVTHLFSYLYHPIMCLDILSSVLWCLFLFLLKNDVQFVFTSSCLYECSCLIYVICVCLVRLHLQLFVWGLVSYLRYLCLFGSSSPPVVCMRAHVLFTLFVFVWFVFTSSCLYEGSCLIYVICVCLRIVFVVQLLLCCVFVLFFFVLCSPCCQFLWSVHCHFL